MRRVVHLGALVTALALWATPVAAQTDTSAAWFANATVGPAFGTPGVTPAAHFGAGRDFGERWSILVEVGSLRNQPFEDRRVPGGVLLPSDDDRRVITGYGNFNVMYRMPETNRLAPYVTAGGGMFLAPVVVNGPFGSNIVDYDHNPEPAANLGGGVTMRLNRWLGVNLDYRHFIVAARETEQVGRFTTGLAIMLK
jgi:hypothetical protein